MTRGEALPEEDEVTRWIKPKLLGRDDDGNAIVDARGRPIYVFPEAFELRDDEDGLSVTWLQHFAQERVKNLPLAAEAFRRTTVSGRLQNQSAFVIATVSAIKEAGLKHDVKLRVIEDQIAGNTGHAEIRRFPRELGAFHSLLAAEVFVERHLYCTLKQLGWEP